MTEAERDTILAALRYYQAHYLGACHTMPPDSEFERIASNDGASTPLTADEIDDLCESVNCVWSHQ